MREILIDCADWRNPDDLFDSFFAAVGAPSWHGRNANALWDSICRGQINKIEIPYLIRLKNFSSIGPGARRAAEDFVSLIKEMRDSGCAVDIVVED